MDDDGLMSAPVRAVWRSAIERIMKRDPDLLLSPVKSLIGPLSAAEYAQSLTHYARTRSLVGCSAAQRFERLCFAPFDLVVIL